MEADGSGCAALADRATAALVAAGIPADAVARASATGRGVQALALPPGTDRPARSALAPLGFVEVAQGGGRHLVTYDVDSDVWLAVQLAGERGPVVRRLLRRGAAPSGPAGRRVRVPRGLSVALMGPDGAGKSTLLEAIATTFAVPVRRYYAGLYAADRRRRLPRLRGLGTVALLLSLWRIAAEAAYHRARGRLVVFDRYPYDALLPLSGRVRRVARWRRAVLARACPAPDVTVVLDAPAAVLRGRRDEQPLEVVEAQRRRYAHLAATLPGGVVVDTQDGADAVRRRVTALVWRRYLARARVAAAADDGCGPGAGGRA